MGKQDQPVVEKQPRWLANAISTTITEAGGQAAVGRRFGITTNAVANRLRADQEQIFPLGWALDLQRITRSFHVVDAIAQHCGGIFIPLPDLDLIDNADVQQRLLETVECLGRHSQYVRDAIADGVIDEEEKEKIEGFKYQLLNKFLQHIWLLYRVYSAPEKSGARDCADPGAVANPINVS